MDPTELVERMLDDDGDLGDPTYQLVYPLGDEDVDLTVHFHAEKAVEGDSDFRPGRSRVKVDDVVRDDTGQSVLKQLSSDQFYDLVAKTEDHFHTSR